MKMFLKCRVENFGNNFYNNNKCVRGKFKKNILSKTIKSLLVVVVVVLQLI